MASGGKGPRSTAASASSSWARSVTPTTRLDRSRFPKVKRKAICAGVPWLAPSAACTAAAQRTSLSRSVSAVIMASRSGRRGLASGPPAITRMAIMPMLRRQQAWMMPQNSWPFQSVVVRDQAALGLMAL